MSGSQEYNSPNFALPYVMPSSIPTALQPFFKPIYTAFQSIIQNLIYYCGIAPRPPLAILSSSNDPTSILSNNVHRFYTQASEAIIQGAAVNLYASAGSLFVRNANATTSTKPCHGFCSQSGGLTAGEIGEVIVVDGCNQNLSGLTVGALYYLSTNSGQFTSNPPTASGNLQQCLGIAITANALLFLLGPQVQH